MVRKPRRLQPGDRVVVVSPSGPGEAGRLDKGLEILRGWGLDVAAGESALASHPRLSYLAGEDQARAADFRDAWLDDTVAAVICSRGGYGAQRMMPYLDPGLADITKLLVGFSDITALHGMFNSRGLVTVHGPMACALGQLRTPQSHDRLRALLFEPETVTDLLAPAGARSVVGGQASGLLIGGNLSLVAAELGTPTSTAAAGAIVVLEDVDERAYRADRMLTQLIRSGWFDGVAGIVLGAFSNTDDEAEMAEVLTERLTPLGVPMVTGAGIGHQEVNLAVPLGAPALLDADAGTLTLTESPLA